MENSAFQFTKPVLENIEFCINSEFRNCTKQEVQIETKMQVTVEKDEDKDEAVVFLDVEIGGKDAELPFYVKAKEQGNFRWERQYSEKELERLLYQNAPSLLLAYLRPIVAQVTSASMYGSFDIPFMNFTK